MSAFPDRRRDAHADAVSAAMTVVSGTDPNGGRIELPEGALKHPDQTVTVQDVTHEQIRDSLGPDGPEILAALCNRAM